LQEVEITIGRLLRIVWLIAWRGALGGFLLGAIVGFLIGVVMTAQGSPLKLIQLVTGIAGGIVGLIWWIAVLRMALKKQYSDFRIALIARKSSVAVFE
jgi:uncharacterized protein (DUF697 family)